MINYVHNPNGWYDKEHRSEQTSGEKSVFDADDTQDMVLAMSYVKRQEWGEVFECDTGLSKGTVFPVLVKPFFGKGGH